MEFRKLILSMTGFQEYKRMLAGALGDVEIYHSKNPYEFPCFIITMLRDDGISVPWWDHFIVTRFYLSDAKILEYMSEAEVDGLRHAVCDQIAHETEVKRAITGKSWKELDAREEWIAWWDRLDELARSKPDEKAVEAHCAKKPPCTPPFDKRWPAIKEPIPVKFMEEEDEEKAGEKDGI